MKKRIHSTPFGKILIFISALSIFILISQLWDLSGSYMWIRYGLIISSSFILIISLILGRLKIEQLKKIASKSLGM